MSMSATEIITRALLDTCGDGRFDPDDDMAEAVADHKQWAMVTDLIVARLSEHGHTIMKPECDGDFGCPALIHIHGCYSDVGNCDDPDDHDTLIRAETATAAEEGK